ncbi:hypothetical protein JEZ13_04170 [bacterium]|nr:hypothetical protein [bacterium]
MICNTGLKETVDMLDVCSASKPLVLFISADRDISEATKMLDEHYACYKLELLKVVR